MSQTTFQIDNARFELVNDVLETIDGILRYGSHCVCREKSEKPDEDKETLETDGDREREGED